MVEMMDGAVPKFSAMLPRGRLVGLFKSQSPPLTVICAAAGYGKTVLATQLAQCDGFDAAIWVELPDVDASGDIVLHQIADTLDTRQQRDGDLISESVRSLESSALDDPIRIRDGLQKHQDECVLLVIDGVNELSDMGVVVALVEDLERYTSPQSRVVIACRRLEHDESLDPGVVWLIEEEDLAFTIGEVLEITMAADSTDSEEEAHRLFESYSGHPAITRIMLRHGALASDARPRDLIWQTKRIVSRMDDATIAVLYLATVLVEGDLPILQRCAAACDLQLEPLALSRSVPLFCVTDAAGIHRSFRVHEVLCDVLDRLARTTLDDDDRDTIRSVAFEELSRGRDYVRLASALELYGTENELADWCEHDGVSMIRYAGDSSVSRLLAKLSPLIIASSARLLLLRAHVQRASGAPATALESATLAKRVAEVNEDRINLTAAVLLIARLQFDRGSLAESREMLEGLPYSTAFSVCPEAGYLREVCLAAAEASTGRVSDAAERIQPIRHALKGVGQGGSDEAVFAVHCMSTVDGLCRGDWAATAPLLAALAGRTDMSHYQTEHARTNYAAVLVEMGKIDAAERLIDEVIARGRAAGSQPVHVAAMGTLVDALWLSAASRRASEVNDAVVEMCRRSHDLLSLAIHGINAARALRALGECEESLSYATDAEVFLSDYGPSMRMLHLLATIEVAASQLALGDVMLATSTISRVLADSVIAEALGHSLRCDLVRAEIDRLGGHARVGVERLARHATYIAGGSANMTLACYVRAFPGLLSLLDEALGTTGVPMQVIALLPGNTIEQGIASCAVSLGAKSVAAMRSRYGVAESECLAELATAPFVRVRMFGKFEVESSYGQVLQADWLKAKARLLFVMLLCNPGHEIARDVILECLWPEMDRDQALHNFYVTWSHMRKALARRTVGADIGEFARSSSDACWLTSAVDSDLDRFNIELGVLSAARVAGDDAAAVVSAMQIYEIYRGELLPTDIYEESLQEDRTRAKRDFCDAMATGARCAVDAGQYDIALTFLKRASVIDPWREDVYQLMMHCQMIAGQRSCAIETYNTCRTRLVDDLGIDPCSETVRIFQAVLAMEGGVA